MKDIEKSILIQALDHLPVGTLIVDARQEHWPVVYMNSIVGQLTGLDAGALLHLFDHAVEVLRIVSDFGTAREQALREFADTLAARKNELLLRVRSEKGGAGGPRAAHVPKGASTRR